MNGPATAATAVTSIDIPGYGKLSMARDANAPLLVVFGGIDVGGIQSGVYMWNYMSNIKDRFHIFVALRNNVNGTLAYRSLISRLQAKGLTPPSKKILYLFSGGYRPGIDLLTSGGPKLFSSIYLVDIWMGASRRFGSGVPDFYKALVDRNAAKITYVYTSFGANNDAARDYIANKVGRARAILVKGRTDEPGMQVHMRTNTMAVSTLQ
jgi:hypothetical protein